MKRILGLGLVMSASAMAVELSEPVPADHEDFEVWAVAAEVVRGPVDAREPEGALASYGSEADLLGPADALPDDPFPVLSLGDGGTATLRFEVPIADGPGADLAVFENGFDSSFLELAHVEVSSDGIHFTRFPSRSGTQTETQISGYQPNGLDPADLKNLAGKYPGGSGTAFDLGELRGLDHWLDVSRVTHVRVIDVVGSIDPAYGTRDSEGRLINDPWFTNFPSGGFDLDAVGAFHRAPTTHEEWVAFHFPEGGEVGDDEDPDGDEVTNLLEYALGSDPWTRSAVPLQMELDGGGLVLSWRRAREREGVELLLEGPGELSGWSALAGSSAGEDTEPLEAGVAIEESESVSEVRASLIQSGGKGFYQLRAIR